jgi:MFS transporter, ACS family, glucarate transporter
MKQRSTVLGFLALLSVITYFDRVCISVAGPMMQDELGLSSKQWGWVLSAFILAYGLFEIPSGAMGDRQGYRVTLMRIVAWWSVFTSLTAVAWNYSTLVVLRFLFGMGEAGAYPNMAGCIGRWFPPEKRAGAQGVIWSASRIGGALAPWIIVPLMAFVGWRITFLFCGAIGVIWTVVWFAWYRDHHAPQAEADEHSSPIAAPLEPHRSRSTPWGRLFRSSQLWLIMAMYWSYAWGIWFFLTWFPTYLVKGRGLSQGEMGHFAALPFLFGAVGNLVGGYLCDRLSRRFGLAVGRRLVGALGLLTSALFLVATALTTGKWSGILLLAFGFGVMDCMVPAAWSVCTDVGGRWSGAVTGAMNTAGQAGAFISTVFFGYLVEKYGDYNLPLFVIAGMLVASACLFWQIDSTKPLLEELPVTAPPPVIAQGP